MNHAVELLKLHLEKLNDSFARFVTSGDVSPSSPAATDNRQKAKDIQEALSSLLETATVPKVLSVDGYSVDGNDDKWSVNCPSCDNELTYVGFFDKDDENLCKCGTRFRTARVIFENGDELR